MEEVNMSSKGAMALNLSQCLRIQANQYRSSDNRRDYEAHEIEARILELQAKKDFNSLSRALKERNAMAIETIMGADEGQAAAWDYKNVNDEFLVLNNGFSLVAIPPRIMGF